MPTIGIQYDAPSHGWLTLRLTAGDKTVVIDASDVPNNSLQELMAALEAAATGSESSVRWNLEPDGYFMSFKPVGSDVYFTLEFARDSEIGFADSIISVSGSRSEMLLPFWRFLRDFESKSYQDPNWPSVDFSRMPIIRKALGKSDHATGK